MPRLAILGQKRYIEPMGKRLALPLLFLFAVMPALGQEVVVFSDHRSLVVSSHRQSGSWTYLALPGGEIAVPTARITDIHAENISAEAMVATQASMATSSSASEPPQSFVPDSQVAEAGSPSSDSPPPVPSRFGQPILERPKVLQAVRTKGTSAGTLRSLLPGH